MNLTFDARNDQLAKPAADAGSNLKSPIPDIISSAGFIQRQPSLEWEPETDAMAMSTMSMASTSSLGILSETQLMDNSFIGADWKEMLRKKEMLHQQREQELLDAELDKEIAGIATPEIDMSSSTLSGKESSPEPDVCRPIPKESQDLTFDKIQLQTSTPMSPQPSTLKSAGEKLASPMIETAPSKGPVTKLYQQDFDKAGKNKNTKWSPESMDVDSDTESPRDDSYLVEGDVDLDPKSEMFAKRVRTSSNLEEMKCHRLSASFELAKTAVEQYASLVKGAEEEKAHKDTRSTKYEDPKLLALRNVDLMSTSLEGRISKLVTDEDEGLNDVPFPSDLITSFTKSSLDKQLSVESPHRA